MEAMAVDAKTLDDGSYLPPVNIPLITVDKPDQALLGVAHGSAPLEIADVKFLGKNISQSTPLSGKDNMITVGISTRFTVLSSFSPEITITGLLGSSFVGLTSTCDTAGWQVSYVSWNGTTGELVVDLCEGSDMVADEAFEFSFSVINSVEEQSATPVLISMSSAQFPKFLASEMSRPGLTIAGIQSFTDPPRVVVPGLLGKTVRQSRPFSGAVNTITMTLRSNVGRNDEDVSVCCFNNSIAEEGLIAYQSDGTPCQGATWNAASFQIDFHGCTMLAGEAVTLSFAVVNPPTNQQSPAIRIWTALQNEWETMDKPGGGGLTAYGVEGFNDPMRVLVPEFLEAVIGQSTPVSERSSTLTATLQASVELSGSDESIIILRNLSGAVIDGNVTLSAVVDGNNGENLFCGYSGAGRMGHWNSSTSSLTLRLCAGETMRVGEKYAISFPVRNPSTDQESPDVSIEATGVVVQIESSLMTKIASSLLGIEGGASPLKVVVPTLTTKKIAQSTPIAGVANLITITVAANIELRASLSLTVTGLVGATFSGDSAEVWLDDSEDATLMCSEYSSLAAWSMSICPGKSIAKGSALAVTFAVVNPDTEQNAPDVTVLVQGDDLSIAGTLMEHSGDDLIGVQNGSNPLQIVVPTFLSKELSQSSPLISMTNTLSLKVQTNIDLRASESSAVTLQGFIASGMTEDEILAVRVWRQVGAGAMEALSYQLFCTTAAAASGENVSSGLWQSGGDVVWTVCADRTMQAHSTYQLEWTITNPDAAQASPQMSIHADGTALFPAQAVDKPGTDVLGVTRGTDPLLVVVPVFETKSIVQSTLHGGALNTITATLMTNVDLTSDGLNHIVICCFSGAIMNMTVLPVTVSVPQGFSAPQFCSDESENSGQGSWDGSVQSLKLYVCPGSQVSSFEEFSVSFTVTNPTISQASPEVTVSATGSVIITEAAMEKPAFTGELVHGVGGVTDVMRVVVPALATKVIGQSSPFSGQENTLTVTLQSVFALSDTYSSSVTISGLDGAIVSSDTVQLVGGGDGNAGQGLFCSTSGARGYGTWIDDTKSLVLILCDETTMSAGETYSFSFHVTNTDDGQSSPDVQVEVDDLELPVAKSAMTKDYRVVSSIPQGSEVLWILFRDFTTTSVGQTTPIASRENQIRLTLVASLAFSPDISFTVSGLRSSVVNEIAEVVTVEGAEYRFVDISVTSQAEVSFCALNGVMNTAGRAEQVSDGSVLVFWLCTNSSIPAFTDVVIALDITNLATEQPAANLSIRVDAPVVDFELDRALTVASIDFLGVTDGASPFRVMPPRWSTSKISQSVPFPGAANTLSVLLQSTIDLQGSDVSTITITNISGAFVEEDWVDVRVVKDGVQVAGALFCEGGSDSSSSGRWRADTGDLVLSVCEREVFEAISEYEVHFTVTNPQAAQLSPSVFIEASGTATFAKQSLAGLDGSEADVFGVAGGADALFVMIPAFETRSIAQSNFFSGKQNLITATIMTNIDLASEHDSYLSLCCLESAEISGTSVPVVVSGPGVLPEFCVDQDGTGGAGQARWDPSSLEIIMYVCPDADNKISSWSEFSVSFNVTNPSFNQESPTITISAGAMVPGSGIDAVEAVKPGLTVLGVANGNDPMRVVIPEFVVRTASQSTPVSGATNRITVGLEVSVDLSGTDHSLITLSNLTGVQLNGQVPIDAVDGGHAGGVPVLRG